MSIGIQDVAGPASARLSGLDAIGTGIQNVPTAAPVQDTQNLADTWLKPDLQAPLYVTPWGEFNVGPTDWYSNLHGAYDKNKAPTYKPAPTAPVGGAFNTGTPNNFLGSGDNTPVGMNRIGVTEPAQRAPVAANLSYKDPNYQRYIDDIMNGTTSDAGSITKTAPVTNRSFFENLISGNKQPAPISAQQANINALKGSNVDTAKLQAIADKYGVSVDEVQNVYNKYSRARQDIIDPVGANWQNIKNAPFYKDLEAGIQKYTNYAPSKAEMRAMPGGILANSMNYSYNTGTKVDFNKLRSMNPTAALSPEYFALHDPNDAYGRDPYRLTDSYDFLDNGLSLEQSTQAERDAAQQKYLHQKDLLDNPISEGGPFDYRREYIKAGGTKPKGYNWRAEDLSKRGYNQALDISQNFLQNATNGEKNYHDVGFSDDIATKALFEKKKVKKGFLGGALGPLMTLASFIPGPIGIGAKVLSAFNAAATGNPLGAIASAMSFLPGVNGTGLNAIAANTGKAASVIGGALGGGSLGNIAGQALVSGGLGALSGAPSGHALEGALTGAIAPTIGGTLASGTSLSPGMSSAIGRGITGIGATAYNYSKSKQAQQAALKKQLALKQQAAQQAAARRVA